MKELAQDPEVDVNFAHHEVSAFGAACRKGNLQMVHFLLTLQELNFNIFYEKGVRKTPFCTACAKGRTKVVELLLKEPRMTQLGGESTDGSVSGRLRGYCSAAAASTTIPLWVEPLHYPLSSWSLEVVKLLFASDRHISTPDVKKKHKTSTNTQKKSMETEEEFQTRLANLPIIRELIWDYQQNPNEVRMRLRSHNAGERFALVVSYCDGYFQLSQDQVGDTEERKRARRFFEVARVLPMEIQMILCNQASGLHKCVIKRVDSELGFKKYLK